MLRRCLHCHCVQVLLLCLQCIHPLRCFAIQFFFVRLLKYVCPTLVYPPGWYVYIRITVCKKKIPRMPDITHCRIVVINGNVLFEFKCFLNQGYPHCDIFFSKAKSDFAVLTPGVFFYTFFSQAKFWKYKSKSKYTWNIGNSKSCIF